MQYWMKHECSEHLLMASEIATIYGLKTMRGNPHNQLVTKILEHAKTEAEKNQPQLYFVGRNTVAVYSQALYKRAMEDFLVKHAASPGSVNFDGKDFAYAIETR